MFDNPKYNKNQNFPAYRLAELAVSLKKVSGGYSIKINQSAFDDDIGRIVVAPDKTQIISILIDIIDRHDQV